MSAGLVVVRTQPLSLLILLYCGIGHVLFEQEGQADTACKTLWGQFMHTKN